MSFTDRLVLWLHIGFAIFTLGPVALAISSSPRYIRRRELPVLRYLSRITLIFTAGSLLVLIFGLVLAQQDDDFKHPWLTVAMTLFVVAIVLLILIIRDQRSAIRALTPAEVVVAGPATGAAATGGTGVDPTGAAQASTAADGTAAAATPAGGTVAGGTAAGGTTADPVGTIPAGPTSTAPGAIPAAGGATLAAHVASVERGRIAAMGGIVNLIWLVILALMVWRP